MKNDDSTRIYRAHKCFGIKYGWRSFKEKQKNNENVEAILQMTKTLVLFGDNSKTTKRASGGFPMAKLEIL